jgi:hypothetical protein
LMEGSHENSAGVPGAALLRDVSILKSELSLQTEAVSALKMLVECEKRDRLDRGRCVDEFIEATSGTLKILQDDISAVREADPSIPMSVTVPSSPNKQDCQLQVYSMELEMQRLARLTEECARCQRKAMEAVEQERHDRIANHGMLQEAIASFQVEFAKERGERNALRGDLSTLQDDMTAVISMQNANASLHFAAKQKQRFEGSDAASTEVFPNEKESPHSTKGGTNSCNDNDDASSVLDERASMGDTDAQQQERCDTDVLVHQSFHLESGFLDVISEKVRDEVAQACGSYEKDFKNMMKTFAAEERITRETTFALLQKKLQRLEHITIGQDADMDADIVFLPQQGLLRKLDWMKEHVDAFVELREGLELVAQEDPISRREFERFVHESINFREELDSQLENLCNSCGAAVDCISRDEFESNSQRVWDAVIRLQTQQFRETPRPVPASEAMETASGEVTAKQAANRCPAAATAATSRASDSPRRSSLGKSSAAPQADARSARPPTSSGHRSKSPRSDVRPDMSSRLSGKWESSLRHRAATIASSI